MQKEEFTLEDLQEFEALEIRGGGVDDINGLQRECVNTVPGCGSTATQVKCVNDSDFCGGSEHPLQGNCSNN